MRQSRLGSGVTRSGSALGLVGDDSEPEAELREPHGGGVAIYAEQVALQDSALSERGRPEPGDREGAQLEGTEQKCAGSRRGIEEGDVSRSGGDRRIAISDPPLSHACPAGASRPRAPPARRRLSSEPATQGCSTCPTRAGRRGP